MSSELHVDVSRGVAVLTLNRPAQQNAFTPTMAAELGAALQRCDAEDAIRAVIVTGTPPRVCAGADVCKRVGAGSPPQETPPWRGALASRCSRGAAPTPQKTPKRSTIPLPPAAVRRWALSSATMLH
uniref:enoyl-CoA hydratase-related protein n=1 Tax=Nocardia abscessus TaxID=120957 RepID=UPI0024560CE5